MLPNAAETRATIAGLTAREAEARLDKFGTNEPAATQQHSILSDLFRESTNPMALILIIAADASVFLGDVEAGKRRLFDWENQKMRSIMRRPWRLQLSEIMDRRRVV